jgi:hypothetical protein
MRGNIWVSSVTLIFSGALVQNISMRFINMPKYLHSNYELIVNDNEMICTCSLVIFKQIALRDAQL